MEKFLSRLKIFAENSKNKTLEEKVKKLSSDGGNLYFYFLSKQLLLIIFRPRKWIQILSIIIRMFVRMVSYK